MAPKLTTVAEYFLISIALYFFVLSPMLQPYLASDPAEDAPVISYEKSEALVYPDKSLECPEHTLSPHILSTDPLIIYLPHFLKDKEADELVSLRSVTSLGNSLFTFIPVDIVHSASHFEPSTIFHAGVESHDPSIRNSSKALLPRTTTVQCIEARAREFQGWRTDVFIERLWAQRYGPGGHYVHHYDWSTQGRGGSGRVSSFMVYLHANCTGGGTNFPRISKPDSPEWCRFIDCESQHDGITFKALKGSAVYWENFRGDGSGYEQTWHAGLPVDSGIKVGLNIWSWYQPGHQPRE